MKFTLLLLISIFTSTDPIDRIGQKGPIKFSGESYGFVWSDKPHENYYVQEYLPKGETLERFNQMLTINVFTFEVPVDAAVDQKLKELSARKKTDKLCSYGVAKSPDGKEQIIDCVLSLEQDGKPTVAEFLVYRYSQIELSKGKKALLIYSYSKRAYDDGIAAFIKSLADNRTKVINEMISAELPKIVLK